LRVHYLQHAPFEGLGTIADWLERRGAGVTCTRLFAGEKLPDPSDADWVIAMGGPMSVNDEGRLPWLSAEKRFLASAIKAGKTVLGICLGAQLIASALGAPVRAGDNREVGWFPVERVTAGAAAGLLPPSFTAFHWHGETFTVPAGAVHIARSDGCENQAFTLGPRVVGFQFHLEVTPDAARDLCAHCPQDLAPGPYVQTEREIEEAAGSFRAANAVMESVLDRLSA
jgi:GMP synthase-like glutamine amidotransferase